MAAKKPAQQEEKEKTERVRTPSFIVEYELKVNQKQAKQLLISMDCARQIYNAVLGEMFKRLRLMRQSKAWKAARLMKRGKERTAAFKEVNKSFGFTKNDAEKYAKQFGKSWLGLHLGSDNRQVMASRAFTAVQMYCFGKKGKPRFKGKHQLTSVENKRNVCGLIWVNDRVVWNTKRRNEKGVMEYRKLSIPAIINENDPVHMHGLKHRVKYVRILVRRIRGRNRFYVHLICEGMPYQKEKNKVGEGFVGMDLGPSTIAIVAEKEAHLKLFCHPLEFSQRKLRRLQRKLDRQRRANNPDNYNEDGTNKKGRMTWCYSNRYKKTREKIAELHRKIADHRKSLHGQLANDIFRMGHVINLEKLSYVAFQKMFGRSIGKRAPGMFVAMMRRKAVSAGVVINEYNTWSTRHSQLCHGCGALEKKPLSQRHHDCECGVFAQRDLYSAFLAYCMEGSEFIADYARSVWSEQFDELLRVAWEQAEHTNGKHLLPTSFGLSSQRQSVSPVEAKAVSGETQDTASIIEFLKKPENLLARSPCL